MTVKRNYTATELDKMSQHELLVIIQQQSRAIAVLTEQSEVLCAESVKSNSGFFTYNVSRALETTKALKNEVPVL